MKSAFRALAVTAAAAAALGVTPAVASAATAAPAASDPSTLVTFSVSSGALTMTAPVSADLGSGVPGGTITGQMGTVTVTDTRALLAASWTAVASATDWTTGGGTSSETIPAGDVAYDPGSIATTGNINATGTLINLSSAPAAIVTGTAGIGNNTASWDPTLTVSVPAQAVAGTYTGTIIESVS
jgi:hypothetical protein